MKFNLTDVPKMALSALVTAIIIFAILYERTPPYQPSRSERISWNEAARLKADYLGFNPILVAITNPGTGRQENKPLQGFTMNARQMDEIINHNKNGVGGDAQADDIVIYFGMEGTSGTGSNKIANLRIIVAGIKDGVVMKNSNGANINDSSVFDRADPCPPNHVTIN